jgi:hypothetical protein
MRTSISTFTDDRLGHSGRRAAAWLALDPYACPSRDRVDGRLGALSGAALAQGGLATNDNVAGLIQTGAFTADRMAQALQALPVGLTELYTHPATVDAYPVRRRAINIAPNWPR